jgi:hypothetical protein
LCNKNIDEKEDVNILNDGVVNKTTRRNSQIWLQNERGKYFFLKSCNILQPTITYSLNNGDFKKIPKNFVL